MKKILIAATLVVMLFSFAACGNKETMEQYRERRKLEYIQESASAEKGGIVFLGDSITDGYPLDKFYTDYKVINRGITSDTTADVLARLENTCLIMQPKIIVLLIGVNNLGADISAVVNDIEKILKAIFAASSDTKVVLQSLYPLNKTQSKGFSGYQGTIDNSMVINCNKAIKPLAEKYGFIYADVYSALLDENLNFAKKYTGDGLHPNSEGYAVVTTVLKPIVDSLAKQLGITK